ncbi:hypothetical protein PLICRDRAFT_36606 [Plicaturopsis crispa FD-325 SS-3]|nr:hypothetical protein PLICRDRAFT_36606 [Plicaturopsis crispa FD-325 SS-3]
MDGLTVAPRGFGHVPAQYTGPGHGQTSASDEIIDIHTAGSQACPISTLPIEILGEIFHWCQWGQCDYHSITPPLRHAPLVLCDVCHLWRDVALSLPALWSCVQLTQLPVEDPSGDAFSSGWHRSVWDVKSVIVDSLPPLLPWLRRNASYLALLLPFDFDFDFARAISASAASGVETLQYHAQNLSPGASISVWNLAGAAAGLRRHERDDWILDAPWSQLEHVCIAAPVTTAFVTDFFSCSQNLQSVQLELSARSVPSWSFRAFTGHALTSLVLTVDADTPSFIYLLDALTLPALRTLKIKCALPHQTAMVPIMPMPALFSLFARSRPPLTHLTLSLPSATEAELVQCLQLIRHSLCTLKIVNPYAEGSVLPQLVVTDRLWCLLTHDDRNVADAVTFDRLTSLSLECGIESTDGVLADMVQSRFYAPSGPFKMVELRIRGSDEGHNNQDLWRLEQLLDDGQLSVQYIPK